MERRVEDLERQIAMQEKQIKLFESELEDPTLFEDRVRAHKVTTRYETAKKLVVTLMKEWETNQAEAERLLSE